MNPSLRVVIALLLVLTVPGLAPAQEDEKDLLKRLFQKIKENDDLTQVYGYMQEAYVRDLDENGNVTKEEKRLYRVIWLEDEPYNELIQVDGKPPDNKRLEEEKKRRNRFLKAVRENKPEYKLGWDDLLAKYDYKLYPPAGGAAHVIAFEPRKGKLKERTRGERVLNNLAGKVWIGSDFNIMKGIASITRDVKYGFGIIANLDQLEIEYAQQQHEGVWLPRSLKLTYSYRILIKGKHEQYESRFFDIYRRPGK